MTQIPARLASRSISAKTVLSRGGVDSACLRSLCFNGHISTSSTTRFLPVKIALINARSVANKTFILNDIIASHELDILFVTETWLRTGDLSPFTELCPPQWGFLNSPRISGRGGGLATVFKNIFKCKILPVKNYSSFEVQLFKLANCLQTPLLCALVYRSPKATGCFIHDFSDLLSALAIQSDKMLILGDFNIHVCCPAKPMVNEFLALLDSFNLTQSICGSTHIKGHTLDLVLSSGISVDKLDITNVAISDHFLIEFEFSSYSPPSVPPPSHVLARSFNSATASLFSNSFKFALPPSLSADLPSCTNIDELVSSFNLSCTNTLDQIAPIKLKRVKSNTLTPWVDSSIQVFRQACRQAERKWKKDKLQVSYDIFLQHLKAYQVTVKKAKAHYFSELINSQANRPKVLFKAIDTFLNPANTVDTSLTCDEFSDYFIRKIDLIRSNIITQGRISVTSCSPANFLQHFTPLSSPELSDSFSP